MPNTLVRPAMREWEEAGTVLSSALSNYLSLCKSLKTKSLQEGIHPIDLANHIDSTLGTLQVVLDDSRSQLTRARNEILSPLSRIPEELLTEIFMDVVFDTWRPHVYLPPSFMEKSLTNMSRSLCILSAVCSAWRNIVLSHNVFWSTVMVYRTPARYFRRTIAPELSLSRAKESTLHLAAVLTNHLLEPRKIVEMTNHLTGHTPRIRTINIHAHTEAMEFLLRTLLKMGHYPLLSELSLSQTDFEPIQDVELPEPFHAVRHDSYFWEPFTELLESLSVLRIARIAFGWRHMAFSNRLVELHLQQLVVGQSRTLAGLLNSAPELRRLKIISVRTFHDSSEASDTILLYKLESLLLEDLYFNTLEFLFKSIVPGPYRLELHITDHSKQSILPPGIQTQAVDIENLCSILNLVSVHTLSILHPSASFIGGTDRWLTGPELHGLLKSVPNTKILNMKGWSCDTEAAGALKRPQGDGEPFPKFEQLHLSSTMVFDQDSFKDAVASHSPQKMVFGGDLCWQGVWVPIYDGMDLAAVPEENLFVWLRSNIPEFHILGNRADTSDFHSNIWQLW